MTLSRRTQLLLVFAVITSVTFIGWNCSTEKMGPKDPSSIEIAKIVEDLGNARTAPEAEAAIEHLLNKTGIGRPIKGSRYNDYELPDAFVSDLAQTHLRYLQDAEYALTWGEAYEIEVLALDESETANFSFEAAVARFREQAAAALTDPENPNSALLLAIAADGPQLPAAIPAYDQGSSLSAVQDFLFGVWLDFEFLQIERNLDVILAATNKFHFPVYAVVCPDGKVKKDGKITVEIDKNANEHATCLKVGRKILNVDVKDCRKAFKQEKKDIGEEAACLNLIECVDPANQALLDWIDYCEGLFHDQGGN
jgi:hypothetical protein